MSDEGSYLLSCGNCGADLGKLEGPSGFSGRTVCERCGWWIEWQFIDDPDFSSPIAEFFNWRGAGFSAPNFENKADE